MAEKIKYPEHILEMIDLVSAILRRIIVLDIDNLMYFPLPRIELPVYEKAA